MNQCKVKIGSAYDPRKRPRIEGDMYRLQGVLIQSQRMSHADRMDRFIGRLAVIIGACLILGSLLAIW
jgi:hypothetical protein